MLSYIHVSRSISDVLIDMLPVVIILVNKIREYRLLSGVVTREEGHIEKGTTTDVSLHLSIYVTYF